MNITNIIIGTTFDKPKRCQCKNVNGKTCKNKHKTLYKYNNKYFCWFHNNLHNILLINYFIKYAIIIQAYYMGYKQRKIINNIYAKLPYDLQRKIVFHIRENYYHNKYLKTIESIMINKLKKFNYNIYIAYEGDNLQSFKYFEYVVKNRDYIIHIYKLYSKYSRLLSKNFIKNSHYVIDNLMLMNFKIVKYKYSIYNAYTNDIYEVTNATYYTLEKILFDGGFMSQS
tara:strand:+ start:824 stop:1504 length:681 start_codon:yes stop_codon:yes gene_type:complete